MVSQRGFSFHDEDPAYDGRSETDHQGFDWQGGVDQQIRQERQFRRAENGSTDRRSVHFASDIDSLDCGTDEKSSSAEAGEFDEW